MNTKSFCRLAFLAVAGVTSTWGCAHEGSVQQNEPPATTSLTGSFIPQNVKRDGPVTNGKDDLRVLDQSDLNRSGGADVNQALRLQGVNH